MCLKEVLRRLAFSPLLAAVMLMFVAPDMTVAPPGSLTCCRAQLDVLTRGNSEAQVAAEAKLVELKSSFEVRECVCA
jgi:hypothetical protein